MIEVNANLPVQSLATTRTPTTAGGGLVVRLQDALQGLLQAGQTASAEIIEVQSRAPEFQLTLRLQLGNGQTAELRGQSSSPVAVGQQYDLATLDEQQLLLAPRPNARPQDSPLPPSLLPLTRLDPQQTPPGTQLQARITDSTPDGDNQWRSMASILSGPLGGRRLTLDSGRALPVGSRLTLAVEKDLSLRVLADPIATEQPAIRRALDHQFRNQLPTSALFRHLLDTADPDGQPLHQRLLELLPDARQLGEPQALARAIARSGLFMESALRNEDDSPLPTDLKAGILRLLQQLPIGQQAVPGASIRPPHNPYQQQQPSPLDFPVLLQRPLPEGGEPRDVLLRLAMMAIARLQTHQLSSLAQTQLQDGQMTQTWQLELPMRHDQQILPLQLWIQRRDEETPDSRHPTSDSEPSPTVWKLDLAFELPPLGSLQVQARLVNRSLSAEVWTPDPEAHRLISGELEHFQQRLEQAGFSVEHLASRQGHPPRRKDVLERGFIHERA